MPYMLIRHKVADYAKWKPAFDAHAPTRKAGSSRGGQLFRTADDPNHILILFEIDDVAKARQFAESEDLRETMQRAGVVEQPDIYFLEEIERPPA
jgi:hypothetical protein